MAYMSVHISRCLKEELTWAIDKQLWHIIDTMLFKTVTYTAKNLKNKAIFNFKQYYIRCYVTLSNVFQLMRIKM